MANGKKQAQEKILETDADVKLPVEEAKLDGVNIVIDENVETIPVEKVGEVTEPVIEPIEVETLPEIVNEPVKPKGDQFSTFSKPSVIPSVEPKLYDKKQDGKYETVKFVKDLTEIKIIDSWVSGIIGETKKITSEQANILRRAKVIL